MAETRKRKDAYAYTKDTKEFATKYADIVVLQEIQ